LAGRANVDLVVGEALAVDLAALDPRPSKRVANLRYNIATPLVAETLIQVHALQSWCVMVQREVAERFFAEPGTKAYGAVSVLVRLHARRTGFHPVSRTVFRPPPNVDSALVAFERISPPPNAESVRRVVTAAFAHRRKTLAIAVALAGLATRADAVTALEAIGRRSDARAEALRPGEFVRLTEALTP
jgi:16S rRNA (adenine1518-N6/adenine1519-N6)-dimethyltransferase